MVGHHEHLMGTARPLSAEVIAVRLSTLLATPGAPVYSVANLRRADHAFDLLDGLMRGGAPLPFFWPVSEETDGHDGVTELYDATSEALRRSGGVEQSFAALRTACARWRSLDLVLREGSPLPEPWQR